LAAFGVLGYISPSVAAPSTTTCSLSTLKGSWAGASTPRLPSGLPSSFSWLYMEYWDGAGNAAWMQFNSYGTSTSGWVQGTNKYTVSSNCSANDLWGPLSGPVTSYVNPDGSGLLDIPFSPNSGKVNANTYVTISRVSLPAATSTCSNKTLSGTYATSTVEYNAGVALGYFSRRSFSANGTYTYIDIVENGTTVTPRNRTGTYTVAGNCTAYFYDNGATTPTYAAIVAPNSSQYWWLNITNDGTFATGHATQISPSLVNNASYP